MKIIVINNDQRQAAKDAARLYRMAADCHADAAELLGDALEIGTNDPGAVVGLGRAAYRMWDRGDQYKSLADQAVERVLTRNPFKRWIIGRLFQSELAELRHVPTV